MPEEPAAAPAAAFEREIGRRHGERPGPTLIVVGGVHGNEPAGVQAAARVLARLEAEGTRVRGDLVAFAGNVRALRAARRYHDRDLNRMWKPGRMEGSLDEVGQEGVERQELRAALDGAIAAARGPVHFLDLHTTSAEGIPFAMTGDAPGHRAFSAAFPLPIILGLEEQLDGVISEYMSSRGVVTLAVEGGQHASPASAENLEATLWVALAAAGLADARDLPAHAGALAHLTRERGGLPRVIEVLSRHAVTAEDAFKMEPGFANIGRVRAGELLAHDRRGAIRAPSAGVLLLPLYQAQGDDGFFFGREVAPWELRLSAWARQARLDALLPALPGVHRVPPTTDAERLAVAGRAAALYPPALFRWLGYRRQVVGEDGTVELRRRAAPIVEYGWR